MSDVIPSIPKKQQLWANVQMVKGETGALLVKYVAERTQMYHNGNQSFQVLVSPKPYALQVSNDMSIPERTFSSVLL